MGLTLFTWLAALIMLVTIVRIKNHGTSARAFRIAAYAAIAYAILLNVGYLLAADYRDAALMMLRLAGAGALVSYLASLRLAFAYPYDKRLLPLDIALFVVAAAAIWFIGFTDSYLVEVKRLQLELVRFEGDWYFVLAYASAGLALLTAVVMIVRAITIKSRVYSQHLWVMGAGLIVNVVWGFTMAILSPSSRFAMLFPLAAANGIVSVLATSYAFSSTRVFQTRGVLRAVGVWFVILLAFGLPAALGVGTIQLFRDAAPVMAIIGGAAVFLVFGRWAESFARGRIGAERDESAREELESAIAHVDLSAGREAALKEVSAIMTEIFGCSWFAAFSEDDAGDLRRIFPDDIDTLITPSGSPVLEALASVERRAILKTDVVADRIFVDVKQQLLAFFEALGAEALIIAKEGRRVVGLFAFGPKTSGADYDALDYAAFDAVHGKLFVIAYYARHVARESLLETVEQEIGLADQIIRSIQEHIDPIEHEGVTVAVKSESPRRLGGDLFDSVRISEHRWFFVVGDVSGKGLNASMSMVILKSIIRTLLREEKDFIKLVSRTNTFIKERLPRGTFFSGMFGFLALDKGSIYFINCGIPAMLFNSPGLDSIIETQGEGKMLGFVKNIEPFLKTRRLVLPAGSRVLITTDGILEAESVRGDHYGKERLVRILAENKKASPSEVVDAIAKSAGAFTGGRLDDDITIVAIDYAGRPKEKKQ